MKKIFLLCLICLIATGCSNRLTFRQQNYTQKPRDKATVQKTLDNRRQQLLDPSSMHMGNQVEWTEVPAGTWLNKPYKYATKASVDQELPKWAADEVSKAVIFHANLMHHRYNLCLEESHVFFDGCIYRIRLDFTSQHNLKMCEARDLLVDLTQDLLSRVNALSRIRPLLCAQPFAAEDLEIYIDFRSFYGQLGDQLMVGGVMLDEGISHFFAQDIRRPINHKWHQHIEPYAKSLLFVNLENEAEEHYHKEVAPPIPPLLKNERLYSDAASE